VFSVSRQAVAQHLTVLEEARLVTRRRVGRRVLFTVHSAGLTVTATWLAARAAARRNGDPGGRRRPVSPEGTADLGKDI